LFTDLGDADGTGRTLWLRGIVAGMQGDLPRAERLLEKSVDRHRDGVAAFYLGWSLRMLGRIQLLQGRPAEAREHIEESLRLFAPAGDVSAILLHLADFATIAALEGHDERELRLAGALDHLRRLTGIDLVDHPVNAIPGLHETVTRLGKDGERLLAEGASMSIDEIVEYALQESG
jgi:tetratricopeptide (TPR) repeat protein